MTSFTPDPIATRYHFEVVNGKDLSVAVYLKGQTASFQHERREMPRPR
jgi:hypothetical protein